MAIDACHGARATRTTALRDDPDEADRWAGTIALSVDREDSYASSYVREVMAVQE